MTESIKELRKICQESRDREFYVLRWFDGILFRKVSIYLTKLCLIMGISANQATFICFFIGITAGVFFVFADIRYWILGALLLYLSCVFDRVDGEIARYNKSAFTVGKYLDEMAGIFICSYIWACISFGTYSAIQDIRVLIFGFVAVMFFLLTNHNLVWSAYSAPKGKGLLAKSINNTGRTKKSIILWGYSLFDTRTFPIVILAVTLIDCFTSPATISYIPLIGSLTVNARFSYLIIYAVAMLTGFILTTFYVVSQSKQAVTL